LIYTPILIALYRPIHYISLCYTPCSEKGPQNFSRIFINCAPIYTIFGGLLLEEKHNKAVQTTSVAYQMYRLTLTLTTVMAFSVEYRHVTKL